MPVNFHALSDIAFRSAVVYLFMIIAFRLFGKRELSQLSIADLVLIVLISNAVQNAMVGDNSTLIGGLTAGSVLFIINLAIGYLMFRYKKVRTLIQPVPMTLISDGKIVEKHMKEAMITEDELNAAVREHGVSSCKEVTLAILEADGNISVISGDDKKLVRTKYHPKRKHKTMMDM